MPRKTATQLVMQASRLVVQRGLVGHC